MNIHYIEIGLIAGKRQYLTDILPNKVIPTNTILYKKLTGLGATYGEIKAKRNKRKLDFIDDEIVMCNNNYPEDGVVNNLFDDNDEHWYKGKFYDGIAILHKDPEEEESVPEKVVMTYPTMEVVKTHADIAYAIRDYAGLRAEDDINYFHIALKYGQAYTPSETELPF